MQKAKADKGGTRLIRHVPWWREDRSQSFARRLRALGIHDEDVPADRDDYRNGLTRRIYMWMNNWYGCPERACRRLHGCMAPNIVCEQFKNEPSGTRQEQAKAIADILRLIKTQRVQLGLRDEDD